MSDDATPAKVRLTDGLGHDPLTARLSGRCANGYERGQGRLTHLVPYSEDLARNGYSVTRALCGAKPGARTPGWSYMGPMTPTCRKCINALPRFDRVA